MGDRFAPLGTCRYAARIAALPSSSSAMCVYLPSTPAARMLGDNGSTTPNPRPEEMYSSGWSLFANRYRCYRRARGLLPLPPPLIDETGDQRCPTGLMAGAEALAVVAVKEFMKQKMIAPFRLPHRMSAVTRALITVAPSEQGDQAVRENARCVV